MMRLKSKLLSLYHEKSEKEKVKIFSPANTEELRIPFRLEKTARVVGRLAEVPPPASPDDPPRTLNGVLVQNDFKLSLMAPEDLKEYAGLTTTTIMCKQRLTLSAAGIDLIRWALEGTFGALDEVSPKAKPLLIGNGNGAVNGTVDGKEAKEGDGEKAEEEEVDGVIDHNPLPIAYMIMGCVIVRLENNGSGHVTVEWEGNMLNDGIADAVLAVLFSVESSPAAVKQSASMQGGHGHGHSHDHEHDYGNGYSKGEMRNIHANVTPEERFERLCMFLEAQFGNQITPIRRPKILFPSEQKKIEGVNGIKSEPADEDGTDVELAEEEMRELEAEEMDRLIGLGIPVPGVEIRVDKNVARVWLEDLDVECKNAVLRDRVKAVVERAVETVAPLWAVTVR